MPLPVPKPVVHSKQKLRLLLYGGTGAGKTTTSGTTVHHEALRDVLVLNFDRGEVSLPSSPYISVVDLSDGTHDSIGLLNEVIAQMCLPPDKRQEGYGNFKTLVIDSISAFKDFAIADLGGQEKGWKVWTTMMTALINGIDRVAVSQQVHLILLAGSKEVYQEGQLVGIKPQVNPALWDKVSFRVDYILYNEVAPQGWYRIRTAPTQTITAKVRNMDFSNNLAKYNLDYNRKVLVEKGYMSADQLKLIPDSTLSSVMFADDKTLTHFYNIYLSTFGE